ncbi:MAG: hypothetical protein RBU30_10240 [Polyangia bacterium]|jgi:hypothetical protein|nr:hypothetical protein [Polyangia bacterium]
MSDDAKTEKKDGPKRMFKATAGGAVETTGKRGLQRIPLWLTRDKGLPDWLAGSVVVVACGLLLMSFVWILVLVWPG